MIDISWDDCPADLDLLEQVTLARNRSQHPDKINTMDVHHTGEDRQKHPRPFFISESERLMLDNPDMADNPWMDMLSVHLSRDTLFSAIKQVEMLAEWLEEYLQAARWRKKGI